MLRVVAIIFLVLLVLWALRRLLSGRRKRSEYDDL